MTPEVALKSVLVVDDHEDIRVLLRDILEDRGYQVCEAADGSEAIKLCGSAAYDLVIVDLIMPGREGIETIRELRAQRPDLKILAMSGAVETSYLSLARLLGADDTLRKPFDAVTIAGKLDALLADAS